MKKLEEEFNKGKLHYKQLKRHNSCILHEQSRKGIVYGYTVIKVVKRPQRYIHNKIIESNEAYPSNEEFGNKSWQFNQYDNALNFFNVLIEKGIEKANKVKMIPNLKAIEYI